MVDFHTMKAFGKGRQLQVRRLGTASHVSVAPQVARSFQQQLTRWLWYWFDEENEEWIEYGQIVSRNICLLFVFVLAFKLKQKISTNKSLLVCPYCFILVNIKPCLFC